MKRRSRDEALPSGTVLLNQHGEEIMIMRTHHNPGREPRVELVNRSRQTRSFMTPGELAWMLRTGNYTKKRSTRRDPERFPASAGPWLDVRFETESAARRFAKNVRKVLGYRASIDERNPKLVVTNAER